jgi:hypothetical protein
MQRQPSPVSPFLIMLKELDVEYDWKYVFAYANGEQDTPLEVLGGGETKKTATFDREDVEETIAMVDGEADGANWIFVGKLKDGRYAYVTAGCDYTGWG